jgi:hypothetical protein
MEYELEFVTAILFTSTALMGLAGLFLGHIKISVDNPSLSIDQLMRLSKFLSASILGGILAIFTSLFWFISPSAIVSYIALLGFGFQTFIFVIAAIRLGLLF